MFHKFDKSIWGVNMSKCPSCGANMITKCEYCGYELPVEINSRTFANQNMTNNPNIYANPNPYSNVVTHTTIVNFNTAPDNVIVRHVTHKPKKINRFALLLLCFLFGWCGVHYFVTRKIGMGILYLLTFGLFGFGWLIDILRILFGLYKY